MGHMLSKLARLSVLALAVTPAAFVVYVLAVGLSTPLAVPLGPLGPAAAEAGERLAVEGPALRIDADSPWDALARAAADEAAESPPCWRLLAEDRPIHERRKTLAERKAFDRRTIIGDRPQDWHAAWRQKYVSPLERAKFDPKTGAAQRYDRTTRVMITAVGRYAQTGYKSRLGELMRTPPKTLFLSAYRHPNGTYFRSSPLRQAAFHQPLLMNPSLFGRQRLTNDAGRYVFQTGNYAKGKTFLNDYLAGSPSFAPSFYQNTQLGEFRARLSQRWLREKAKGAEAYYGRRERAVGLQARQMPVTISTIPLHLTQRTPGVVYFRDRGYGTYNREYYHPPVPRIYRNTYQRLMPHPVAHATPFTAP